MQAFPASDEAPLNDLDFGIVAMANVRASLAFTLECLSRASVSSPDLKEALENVLSLASRREMEVRVLRNIQNSQLASGVHGDRACPIASPYEALKRF